MQKLQKAIWVVEGGELVPSEYPLGWLMRQKGKEEKWVMGRLCFLEECVCVRARKHMHTHTQ